MTKGTIKGPTAGPRPQMTGQATTPQKPSSTAKAGPTTAQKKTEQKKQAQKESRVPAQRAQRPQRPQRGHGAGGAHGAAAGAEHHDEGGGEAGAGAVGAADAGDELHRRRHSETIERYEQVEEHHDVEQAHETGATGPDAIKRSKGGDSGGSDGFDQGQNQREAYEAYLRGNVRKDQERFDELRSKGTKDDFRLDRPALEVEALGTTRAAAHMVRLYDAWTLDGASRADAIQKAATFLAEFHSVQNVRKVLAELESKPIRDVYPLEVLLKILDERPEVLPGVRTGAVLGNVDALNDGKKILAGVPVTISVPTDVRLKSFALLGGGRPGYEFHPKPEEGKYELLVDTPGRWTFAVLAAPLSQLGRIQRETSEAIVELFTAVVYAMDKKGEPLSPEEWQALQGEIEVDDDDGADDAAEQVLAPAAEPAPPLAVQVRKALDGIVRDEVSASGAASATTYSWSAAFFKPGAPVDGEPILKLSVERANAFDVAWIRAREALAQKQKEHEPSRQPVTQEDFQNALRRARVR